MTTPWDRAAVEYLKEWVPRFVPYHQDLISEMALTPGQRVLVVSAGPASEAVAAARVVGERGRVRATDASDAMVHIAREQVARAGFGAVECAVADASDVRGGPWDAILCAFGLWQIPDRAALIRAWSAGLAEHGKIGILTWAPGEPSDPLEILHACLAEIEPACARPSPRIECERDCMEGMFKAAGLSMVRHTVVRHALAFRSAEALVTALAEGCIWRRVYDELGEARFQRVAARFYTAVGGPDVPINAAPPAVIAISCAPRN